MAIDNILTYCSPELANVTICCMLLHAVGNPMISKILALMKQCKSCCMNESDYVGYFKGVSIAMRRTSRWINGESATLEEIALIAYWEIAIGRSRNISDWDAERIKRTEEVVWLRPAWYNKEAPRSSNELYLNELSPVLDDIMVELVPEMPYKQSFVDAIERRQMWASSGATCGEHFEMDVVKHRANKHTYLDCTPKAEIIAWLEGTPKIQATASEKLKVGKSRAIYGTAMRDYVIMTYSIGAIERYLANVVGVESGLTFGGKC